MSETQIVFEGEEQPQFFAPVSSDAIDGLVGEYDLIRRRIEAVAVFNNSNENAAAIFHFLEGYRSNDDNYGRYSTPEHARLFSADSALGSLNATYWSRVLALTDVMDVMPQKRRDEWHEQIRNPRGIKADRDANKWKTPPLPDFEDATVRSTIQQLLAMRSQFLSERVDGIFRGLSGDHVTNAPEAFGKRMIIAGVMGGFGIVSSSRAGLVNDLRSVIARFMGRDDPKYWASDALLKALRQKYGEWVTVDGGALRVRLYMKGTVHLEVHPDMAWRLNAILAQMHPAAIPAKFRQRPIKTAKKIEPIARPLPFRVIELLSGMEPATRKVIRNNRDYWETMQNCYTLMRTDSSSYGEACDILRSLGGGQVNTYTWEFEYDPKEAIHEIVASGCIPDVKAHQFYPTPTSLATRVAIEADIMPDMSVLEPSAGHGALADAVIQQEPRAKITCIELAKLNARVLEAKKHKTILEDFIPWAAHCGVTFDRVVMNPPFSEGRAEAHTRAAAALVAKGGRLVAILPSGQRTRLELAGFDMKWSEVLDGAFPGVSVSVVILTADKQ